MCLPRHGGTFLATWRILIVDDEPEVREVLGAFLTGQGHDVVIMASGREALDYLGKGPPVDVALVDWNMPGITGRDVIESVRERSPTTGIVIIAGRDDIAMRKAQVQSGAVGVLKKPFPLRELATWVERAALHVADPASEVGRRAVD